MERLNNSEVELDSVTASCSILTFPERGGFEADLRLNVEHERASLWEFWNKGELSPIRRNGNGGNINK